MKNNKLCFVIMGYGKKTDSYLGKTYDLDKTYVNIIKPSVEEAGYICIRGDEIKESAIIDKSMYSLLIYADLVIADITTFNPNAIYELGVRHAVRPYSTIIMKEEENTIPFDLSHLKIFQYTHMGEDIGVTEAKRCQNELKSLILNIEKSKVVDSPMFQYVESVKPITLPENEYVSLIKELADKEKHIFAIVEHAKKEMIASNFVEAAKLWKKALDKVENEAYYIQQYALCTYKSEMPSKLVALNDALNIINRLEPDKKSTNDPETLGITGAIYKRQWMISKDITYLDRAILFYGKGFKINSDYYTGENYALCLEFKSQETTDKYEKIYYIIEAKKTREAIVKIIHEYFKDHDFHQRSDIKWVYATLANCLLALNKINESIKYEKMFLNTCVANWEKETYEKSKKHIINLKTIIMTKIYKVFISHSWSHVNDLKQLKNLLESRGYFNVSFEEASPDVPINSDDSEYIKTVLRKKIKSSDVVLGIAGIYASHSDWMEWELTYALKNNIPIIGIAPRGQINISKTVTSRSKQDVKWNTESIISAIRFWTNKND